MINIICIGDPHFKTDNIKEVELFIERIEKLIIEKNPDIVVCLGDLLHTHERLHTIALNKAYEFLDKLRRICLTYVLVGNHDATTNQIFLTENHWMNGLKEWDNIIVVDKIKTYVKDGELFIFSPYVPPGRFIEALNTLNEYDWKEASCIFAHQEFFGCKMGAIVSSEGDKWSLSNPHVVSGHIHSRQIIQENIYYVGSAMQHAFGESEKNVIAYLSFSNKTYEREEIDLKLPRKKIIYMNVQEVNDYIIPETEDKIKVTLSGVYEEFKSFKKTHKYKELTDSGIKVIFKPKKIELIQEEEKHEELINKGSENFKQILHDLIILEKNKFLNEIYEKIILNN